MKINPGTGVREIPTVEDVRRSLEYAAMKKVEPGDEVGAMRARKKAQLNAPGLHAMVLALRQLLPGKDER